MTKKQKHIENAQKLLQKGQLDKAIKEYQEAVALEPGDQRTRQRLAELLSKASRFDEARAELEVIGKNLAGGGFYLKAIAVTKQVERLFPDDVNVMLTLASLNEKHGLVAQAMAEYKRAYDYYERLQNSVEAVKVLKSMEKADPQNVNIRLKLAEVLYQGGKRDESLKEFSGLAAMLVARRDDAAFARLSARMQELFPENADFSQSVIENQIESGNFELALHSLQSLLKVDPKNLRTWQLIVSAYDRLGDISKLKAASLHFLKFYPNELAPTQYVVRSLIAEKNLDGALAYLEEKERVFVDSSAVSLLKKLYEDLVELAPVDVRVMKGMVRACGYDGDTERVEIYSAKIASLSAVGSKTRFEPPPEKPEELGSEEGFEAVLDVEEVAEQPSEPAEYGEIDFGVSNDDILPVDEHPENDLYEIEVEIDMDEEPVVSQLDGSENWFETVIDIFDNISTDAGKVKFGEGLDQGDSQSHYDLGTAFREMGLFDEAINEFRIASEDPARRIDCMIQQGGCLRSKGELVLAENAIRSLLSLPALSLEDTSAIKYELAMVLDELGRGEEASRLYQEIELSNPAFRDVKARIENSGENSGSAGLDFNEDELLGFELK